MEWFIDRLGLGDGELEFVDVGVPEILSVKWSSFGGDDANTCAPTEKNIHGSYIMSYQTCLMTNKILINVICYVYDF